MRRSNCSAPIPPGQPRRQRKNVCNKKGRGTWKKGEISDYIGRGKDDLMSPGVPGGMGAEQFDTAH